MKNSNRGSGINTLKWESLYAGGRICDWNCIPRILNGDRPPHSPTRSLIVHYLQRGSEWGWVVNRLLLAEINTLLSQMARDTCGRRRRVMNRIRIKISELFTFQFRWQRQQDLNLWPITAKEDLLHASFTPSESDGIFDYHSPSIWGTPSIGVPLSNTGSSMSLRRRITLWLYPPFHSIRSPILVHNPSYPSSSSSVICSLV